MSSGMSEHEDDQRELSRKIQDIEASIGFADRMPGARALARIEVQENHYAGLKSRLKYRFSYQFLEFLEGLHDNSHKLYARDDGTNWSSMDFFVENVSDLYDEGTGQTIIENCFKRYMEGAVERLEMINMMGIMIKTYKAVAHENRWEGESYQRARHFYEFHINHYEHFLTNMMLTDKEQDWLNQCMAGQIDRMCQRRSAYVQQARGGPRLYPRNPADFQKQSAQYLHAAIDGLVQKQKAHEDVYGMRPADFDMRFIQNMPTYQPGPHVNYHLPPTPISPAGSPGPLGRGSMPRY